MLFVPPFFSKLAVGADAGTIQLLSVKHTSGPSRFELLHLEFYRPLARGGMAGLFTEMFRAFYRGEDVRDDLLPLVLKPPNQPFARIEFNPLLDAT
jgi:hypothetical protein